MRALLLGPEASPEQAGGAVGGGAIGRSAGGWSRGSAVSRETLAMPAHDSVGLASFQLHRERLHRARLPCTLAHECRRLQRPRLCRERRIRAMQHDQADCKHVSRWRLAQAQFVGCSGQRLQGVLRVGAPRCMLWAPSRQVRRRPGAWEGASRHSSSTDVVLAKSSALGRGGETQRIALVAQSGQQERIGSILIKALGAPGWGGRRRPTRPSRLSDTASGLPTRRHARRATRPPQGPGATSPGARSAAARLLQPHGLEVLAARAVRLELVLLARVVYRGHRVHRDLVRGRGRGWGRGGVRGKSRGWG